MSNRLFDDLKAEFASKAHERYEKAQPEHQQRERIVQSQREYISALGGMVRDTLTQLNQVMNLDGELSETDHYPFPSSEEKDVIKSWELWTRYGACMTVNVGLVVDADLSYRVIGWGCPERFATDNLAQESLVEALKKLFRCFDNTRASRSKDAL